MAKRLRFLCIFLFPLYATAQTADFSFQSIEGLFCNPATIQFTQSISGGATGFSWNLGNGLKTARQNPITTYTNAGTYSVRLTVFFPSGPVEVVKNIVIAPAVAPNITVDRDYICQPGAINFTADNSANGTSFEWDFGDSSGVTPSATNTIAHSFAGFGEFSVVVKATNAIGCVGQDTIQVKVRKIPIAAKSDTLSGCIPAAVSFVVSDTLPTGDVVSNYSWDFGDGSAPITNTNATVSHSYTKTGSFVPTVVVATNEGCIDTFSFPAVKFGTPPLNTRISAKALTICGSDSAVLTAKATNANSYLWNFGDGLTQSVTDSVVRHKYTSLGVKTVTVTPFFNKCPGPSQTLTLTVTGVIANYITYNTCTDRRSFTFNSSSVGNSSNLTWDYGDGSPVETGARNVHTFPPAGAFTALLTAKDPPTGCIDTFSRIIYTGNPSLVNADVSICKNDSTTFEIANNYGNPAAIYYWGVVGGPRIRTGLEPTITVKTNLVGNFRDTVFLFNGSSFCPDTLTLDHVLQVRGPKLDYTVQPNVCFGDSTIITNNSVPFVPTDSVISWIWSYGNRIANDSIYQPAPIQYTSSGTFQVKLIATDINGCIDSLTKRVKVNTLPFLQVAPAIDSLCAGQSDSLFAFHSDSILWSPASGLSCTTCDTVVARPASTTMYYITSTTEANCSIQDSILVNVSQPFTASPPGSQYVCLNTEVTLDMNPKNKIIVWSPAASLSNVNIYTPSANPTQTTTYTATLTDSLGCFTVTGDVTVFINTPPTVNAGPDRVVPYNSAFTIAPAYSSNVVSYLWSPATTLNCSTCANPGGTALNTETYTVTVTSDSGCVASDKVAIIIECKLSNIFIPTAFTPNGDNLNDYFYPITRGIKTITKFIIYNREGQKMYEGQNLPPNSKTLGWDGSYKGKRQAPRAYVYVLEALCELGETLHQSGSVLLLR